MYELKTKLNDASVEAFLNKVEDEEKRSDSFAILDILRDVTGAEPKMWGPAIIGFGHRMYKYPDGREMDWFIIGLSPRKANLSLYVGLTGIEAELAKLGKYKTSKGSCLYINKLKDVDEKVLKAICKKSVKAKK